MTPPAGGLPGVGGPLDAAISAATPGSTPDQGQPVKASVTTPKPTKFGRTLELLTMGGFDPTGGADTGQFPDANGISGGSKPAKFGALLNVLRPALEGGAIGAFEGRTQLGGGFSAAQNWFLQQRMLQMQRAQFLMNLAKSQSEIGKNTAEAGWANRRPLISRPAPAIKGTDANGNPVYFSQNPENAQYEEVSGITPPGTTPDMAAVPTNKGIVEYDRHGVKKGAIPLTLAAPNAGDSAASASEPSEDAQGSGSPLQSPGNIPLMPYSKPTSKVGIARNRNAAGVETDSLIDEDRSSPTFGQPLKSNIASRAPLPLRPSGDQDQRAAQTADAETIAGKIMEKAGNDPDKAIAALNGLKISDPAHARYYEQISPLIRKAIRDRAKPGKTGRQRLTPQQAQQLGLAPSSNQADMTGDEDEENQ